MGRVLISLRVIRGTHLPPLNNFSPWDQFIPADMVIGKILPIDQVVVISMSSILLSPTSKSRSRKSNQSRIYRRGEETNYCADEPILGLLWPNTSRTQMRMPFELFQHKIDTGDHLPLHQPRTRVLGKNAG